MHILEHIPTYTVDVADLRHALAVCAGTVPIVSPQMAQYLQKNRRCSVATASNVTKLRDNYICRHHCPKKAKP